MKSALVTAWFLKKPAKEVNAFFEPVFTQWLSYVISWKIYGRKFALKRYSSINVDEDYTVFIGKTSKKELKLFLNLINDSECNYLRLLITIQLKKKTPETTLTSTKFPRKYKNFWKFLIPVNWPNKNFKTHFDILRIKVGLRLKLGYMIEFQLRNIVMEKVYRKYPPKARPRPLFNFGE